MGPRFPTQAYGFARSRPGGWRVEVLDEIEEELEGPDPLFALGLWIVVTEAGHYFP